MAILDNLSTFADGTALGGSTGRRLVGNQIDLGLTGRNVGAGKMLYAVIRVATAVTSGGTTNVTFELVSDAAASIAVDGSASLHWSSGAIAKATLVAGYQIVIPLPQGSPAYERYLGIIANVDTTAVDTGAIDAFLTFDPPDSWKAYADASN